jgi:hypothetical protein
MPEPSLLKMREYVGKISDLYTTRPVSYNALIMGLTGTGKTRILSTCRTPILHHSFDPGGSKTEAIKRMIAKGSLISDIRFEVDDARSATAFKLWDEEMPKLKQMGIFDHLGTFALDGLTSLGTAVMNQILREAGRSNGIPQQSDYLKQQLVLVNIIKDLMSLPCDVIMTGHIGMDKDEVTGKMTSSLFVSGKLVVKIPMLFDEIYITVAKETSKGVEYKLLTSIDGNLQARTRIGGEGKFERFEEPDIKLLLKKAGYPYNNKPPLAEIFAQEGKEEPKL